jgi:hypothetical protein
MTKTCYYNTYDVTDVLEKGNNSFGAITGNGFYNINRERYYKLVIAYGAPKIKMMVRIRYTDGTGEIVITDQSWKTSPSPVTFSSIFGGEDYDAGLEQPGWTDRDLMTANGKCTSGTGADGRTETGN